MLSPAHHSQPAPEIFQPGPKGDAARKDYGDWFAEMMRHEWFANGYHLGYRYDNSPIVVPDGTPAPPLDGKTYTQTARPGARAPHVWLTDGRSTLDLFGRGFVLLRLRRGCAARREPASAPRRSAACRCRSLHSTCRRCRKLYERRPGAGAARRPCRLARRRRAGRRARDHRRGARGETDRERRAFVTGGGIVTAYRAA